MLSDNKTKTLNIILRNLLCCFVFSVNQDSNDGVHMDILFILIIS
nr:MAG TPA: hypothetical protein [Bacteriophage sp.]